MSRFHKLSVIGKVVGEVKYTEFEPGRGVAKFGLPIDYMSRKFNQETKQWEGGESFIINVDVFDRDTRKLGQLVERFVKKGSLVYVEGRLRENKYFSKKLNQDVTTIVLVADNIQFLDSREQGGGMGEGEEEGEMERPAPSYAPRNQGSSARASAPAGGRGAARASDEQYVEREQPAGNYGRSGGTGGGGGGGETDDIPF